MSADERVPGEAFCRDCPDHEACMTGWRCDDVKRVNAAAPSPLPSTDRSVP